MLWVTRAGGNVDRVACPWHIKRFIDNDAPFIYVPADKVLETAQSLRAKGYDAKGADYTHAQGPTGEECTFVTLIRAFGLWGKDAARDAVAKIVNHADTSSETSAWSVPEGPGLEAIARGFALISDDDHQKLAWEGPLYDALYAFCQRKVLGHKPHP